MTPVQRAAVRETAGALAVILASVAGAVLLGAGVWFGLSWMGGAGAGAGRPVEPLEAPAPAPTTAAGPAPATLPPRPSPGTPPATAPTPVASGLEGVVTVLGMPGARITVDGRQAGQSPRELRLTAGTHRIQMSHPTAGDAEEVLVVVAGERKLWSPTPSR